MTLAEYTEALGNAVTDGRLTDAQKASLLAATSADGLPVIVSVVTRSSDFNADGDTADEGETVMVIDLSEIKQHTNIDHSEDDAILLLMIAAAQSKLRAYIGYTLDANGNKVSIFDDAVTCPEPVKMAVRKLTASMYENREGGATDTTDVYDLVGAYRVWSFV